MSVLNSYSSYAKVCAYFEYNELCTHVASWAFVKAIPRFAIQRNLHDILALYSLVIPSWKPYNKNAKMFVTEIWMFIGFVPVGS